MREIEVQPVPLDRLAALLSGEQATRLRDTAVRARPLLAGRVVWHVNATAKGGGVAEMLQSLLSYGRGAGVDTRWLVLDGDPAFFAITKRLHNLLHGEPGDGGPLGDPERTHYRDVLARNLEQMTPLVHRGDIVLLHDPQTAGLVDGLRRLGAHVVWRCHIGRDTPNELTAVGWAFVREHVERSDAFIFSREVYSPGWVPRADLWVIPPSIDPFSPKNSRLTADEAEQVLREAGLLGGSGPPSYARMVVQVSRWDRLKDMAGVLTGFAANIGAMPDDAHLMLVGPDVSGVSDDPEGAEVLAECRAQWLGLPAAVRERVHLVTLPMDDVEENARIVNAVQQHAAIVVQKSIVEGFGLTVTEAMWKARPVIASAVGGIQDQIVDGRDGVLLPDPYDLDAFAAAVAKVLGDDSLAADLGAAARARVLRQFLGDRHLGQYVDLFTSLLF
ncbi:MAG: glycosyltransferase [Nocardioidaceae bacterium]